MDYLLDSEPRNADAVALEYGQIYKTLALQPMTDAEMVKSSLQVLTDCARITIDTEKALLTHSSAVLPLPLTRQIDINFFDCEI